MSRIAFASLFVLLIASAAAGDPPVGFYDGTQGLEGDDLRLALHEIIDDHLWFPYTSSQTDTWDIIHEADQDPDDPDRILDIYRNRSFLKTDHWSDSNRDGWNREHSWPKSYGFTDLDECNYPYTDVHALFACDGDYNYDRSNIPFDWVTVGGAMLPVDGLGLSNVVVGEYEHGSFEVWPLRRGDIARAMFYMDIRYEGGTHTGAGCPEPDLRLTDDRDVFVWSGSNNLPFAYMGILRTLLEWNLEDPPDDRERRRHEIVAGYQGNRNPFIDHPEWACEVYSCEGLIESAFLLGVHLRFDLQSHQVDLTWTGATTDMVDVFRDGSIIATTENDGEYVDSVGGVGTSIYRYQVCEVGTRVCTEEIDAIFASRRRGARR